MLQPSIVNCALQLLNLQYKSIALVANHQPQIQWLMIEILYLTFIEKMCESWGTNHNECCHETTFLLNHLYSNTCNYIQVIMVEQSGESSTLPLVKVIHISLIGP